MSPLDQRERGLGVPIACYTSRFLQFFLHRLTVLAARIGGRNLFHLGVVRQAILAWLLAATLIQPAQSAMAEDAPGFSLRWGGRGGTPGLFFIPSGICVDESGLIYVADSGNDRIQVFSATGALQANWPIPGATFGHPARPTDVAVFQGHVYVVEFQTCRISKFTTNGSFVSAWGTEGTGPGQFYVPEALAVDASGNIYVADGGNMRIQKFGPNGEFVMQWGNFVGAGIAIDNSDRIYVTQPLDSKVQVFSTDGSLVDEWPLGMEFDGGFAYGIGYDKLRDYLFIADYGRSRIVQYTLDGQAILSWGLPGNGNGYLNGPQDVAVDGSSKIYVADTGNDYIQKFDPDAPPPAPRPEWPAKIALHSASGSTNNCAPTLSNCSDLLVTQSVVGGEWTGFAYVLVVRGALSSMAAMQCGISYEDSLHAGAVEVHSWSLCADREFPTPAGSPAGAPGWPESGSGNLITWYNVTNCQVNDLAIAGYCYLSVRESGVLRIIPRPVDNLAAIADCLEQPSVVNMTRADLGYLVYGDGPEGCNPCFKNCDTGTTVRQTTWSSIKALIH